MIGREYLSAIPQLSAEQADRVTEMATKMREIVDETILQQVTEVSRDELTNVILTLMSGAIVVAMDAVSESVEDDGRPILFKGIVEHANDAKTALAQGAMRTADIHLDAILKLAVYGQE
ncbi:MAG: hypothetical protein EOP84_33445 [Verrucomicrobiaceae bacterium]|nr:MAG: hypothetical protein EOP84_33445 [Verrucomicrobiaceae bacterium]